MAMNEEEKVFYCADCLSLKVLICEIGDSCVDYCGRCGSVNIRVAPDIYHYLRIKENGRGKERDGEGSRADANEP